MGATLSTVFRSANDIICAKAEDLCDIPLSDYILIITHYYFLSTDTDTYSVSPITDLTDAQRTLFTIDGEFVGIDGRNKCGIHDSHIYCKGQLRVHNTTYEQCLCLIGTDGNFTASLSNSTQFVPTSKTCISKYYDGGYTLIPFDSLFACPTEQDYTYNRNALINYLLVYKRIDFNEIYNQYVELVNSNVNLIYVARL